MTVLVIKFMFAMVDDSTAFTHLSSLDVKKSTGPDQLSSRFLKEVASEIVVPLTNFLIIHYNITSYHWLGRNLILHLYISVVPLMIPLIISLLLLSQ